MVVKETPWTNIVESLQIFENLKIIIFIIIIKRGGQCKVERESNVHPISPKTPASQYKPIDRNKRKGKTVGDNSWDRAAYANKNALALLLKPASPTSSNTGSARSFQRDTETGIKFILPYCEVLP